jgi:hypothetical protein
MSQLKDMQTIAPAYVKFLLDDSGSHAASNGAGALTPKRNVASADSPAAKLDRILKA